MTKRTFEALIKQSGLTLGLLLLSGLFGLTPSVGSVAVAQGRGGRIEGVVVSAETGVPLAQVEMWLDRVADPDLSPRRRVWTDEAGRFVLDRVRPGRYHLYAQKADYLMVEYGSSGDGPSPQGLAIKAGMVLSDLHIGLPMGNLISGTVRDEQGALVAGSLVKLLALTPSGDSVFATNVASARTDEAGRYRLGGLAPGRYVVRAERSLIAKARMQAEFAYFPDAESWPSATPIELRSGEAVTNVDVTIAFRPEPTVISGTVVDAQTGAPLSGVSVSLVNGPNLSLHTKTAADGRYWLAGVPPGQYPISAIGDGVGDGYEAVLKTATVTAGRTILDFALSPAPLIVATVEYIGSGAAPAPGDYMISVSVDRGARGLTYYGQDQFEFRGLKPGQARIGVGFATLQYRLAAVLVGDQDMTGQTFDLHPGDKLTDVRILITDDQTVDRALEINP